MKYGFGAVLAGGQLPMVEDNYLLGADRCYR